ncbi:MAG: PQQ-binding-like beta-propeller repeat protein [Anaerolineae bacterium]
MDAIDFPIDISDTLAQGYDDFGIYRPRFGGIHTAIDIGFDRWGDPIHAAARGRVTLSSIDEWDTEKGVVVLEHTFPDGSIAYSVYGHVEQGEVIQLPPVGSCVERGDVIAQIGWPSRGKPHLHYELRSVLPTEGGPGYVETNPLELGWYHPIEFTELWRARLQPGFVGVQTFLSAPTLPPALLEDGSSVLALSNQLVSYLDGAERWRVSLGDIATGLTALPGSRVVALARGGQVFTLQNGRFLGTWTADALEVSPVLAISSQGETLVFATSGGGMAAYTPTGTPLWTVPALADETEAPRVLALEASGNDVALVVRTANGPLMRIAQDGIALLEHDLADPAFIAPAAAGGWLALDGNKLVWLHDAANSQRLQLERAPARGSRFTTDSMGNIYLYTMGDPATLSAYDADGKLRWQVDAPSGRQGLSPLLATGGGCLLYTLDADGAFRAWRKEDGVLAAERQLYPGGNQSGSPRARLLVASPADLLTVSAGFLSVMHFDGLQMAGDAIADCKLG